MSQYCHTADHSSNAYGTFFQLIVLQVNINITYKSNSEVLLCNKERYVWFEQIEQVAFYQQVSNGLYLVSYHAHYLTKILNFVVCCMVIMISSTIFLFVFSSSSHFLPLLISSPSVCSLFSTALIWALSRTVSSVCEWGTSHVRLTWRP